MADAVVLGGLASLATGLLTAVGAIPVLAGRTLGDRSRDVLLGLAAGVMLAASFFSLILPALEHLQQGSGAGRLWPAVVCGLGIGLGALAVGGIDRLVWSLNGGDELEDDKLIAAGLWMFVAAVTLHNVPEGLAVGVGFVGGDVTRGTGLALGIGLQNIPEGLAVAVALRAGGYGRRYSVGVAALTGLVEPPAGLVGAVAVAWSEPLLPWALAFAAGAMLFVIVREVIPQSQRHGHRNAATAGLIGGFVIMLLLDVALG